MRPVRRTALHKGSNHARVDAYSTHLELLFNDWLSRVDTKGYSVGTLITQLDSAAEQWFPQAFASGRHQAYPKRRPSPAGQEILQAKILSNRHFLQNSLGPDIDARIALWRLGNEPESLSDALRASFGARIKNMYGGAIWTVTEAGYRAGVGQAKQDLATRITGSLMAEEGDDEEDQPQPGDEDLALALGLTVAGLLLLVALGRDRGNITPSPADQTQLLPIPGILDAVGIQVQVAYNAEDDACDPCAGNAADSPYDEADCPLPGEDCEGRGSCRCSLETAVDDTQQAQAA